MKILVPIDGSQNALRALRHVLANRGRYRGPLELQLINVQLPVASGGVKMFISQEQLTDFYQDEGEAALAAAREMARDAGIPVHARVGVGDPAQTIAQFARDAGCEMVVMGTRGTGAVGSLILGSVATKLIHLTDLPVLLVK